uniref:Ly6/Plaur domain containing 4 n=1 Tax=Jaculus jaculus TaxID=51337 RepID=A0A8C5KNP7_JACJA|nr:ly6/PLAUR domain-containing protein 4 [Jaculus jaculus]
MGPVYLRPPQLLCLLGAASFLPPTGSLLCYEATASLFRAVTLHNWQWLLMRSMVCQLREGCEETILLIETETGRGVVGFKGCATALSHPPQISYLISPPGVSIASYSHVCRTYLCNNLTNLEPFVKLKANAPKSIAPSSRSCPTCVGRHDKECLPNSVTTHTCPFTAPTCYSSTLSLQAGALNTSFLLMGCAREHHKLLTDFQRIGSIQVTEILNILEKSHVAGSGPSGSRPSWGILLVLLPAFRT